MLYNTEKDAITIANLSEYGLAAYVLARDIDRARRVARRFTKRPGSHQLSTSGFLRVFQLLAPLGQRPGVGEAGLHNYLEIQAMVGYAAAKTEI